MDNDEDEGGNLDERKDVGQTGNPLMTLYLIEKMVKLYKTHGRSAADFDRGFVLRIVNAMKGIKSEAEGSSNE